MSLKEKADILSKVIVLTSKLYYDGECTPLQLAFLETMIGAGIWYLPSDKKMLFNGKISKAALNQLKADPKNTRLVEEHYIPRKIAGRALYEHCSSGKDLDGKTLTDMYISTFGKFNYVLKHENSRLAKYQRADKFIDEETAYRLAGIEMETITIEELEKLRNNK